jgi:hypothetical protein
MRKLIKKILKEEFGNGDGTICDTLNINSEEELNTIINKTKMSVDQRNKIKTIIQNMKNSLKKTPTERLDIIDTTFHEVQDILCK